MEEGPYILYMLRTDCRPVPLSRCRTEGGTPGLSCPGVICLSAECVAALLDSYGFSTQTLSKDPNIFPSEKYD